MTRKHFAAIAETIRTLPFPPDVRSVVAQEMADTVGRFNPAFDRGRFIDACTSVVREG